MRTTSPATFLLATLFAAALLSGCDTAEGPKADNAANSPEMRAAIEAERIGNYNEAIRLYQATIDNYRGAALANLQLAILLHEYRKDYLGAIFHYRRYIETAGRGNRNDFSIISNRIEKVEQLLSARYVRAIAESEASGGVQLMKSYAELDQRVSTLKAGNDKLAASNETLRAEIKRLNAKNDSLRLWITRIQNSPTGGTTGGRMDSVTITDEDGNKKVLQTYEVQKGDSLSVIAEFVYGDRSQWPRIRDANLDKVKNGEIVRPGDVLVIP